MARFSLTTAVLVVAVLSVCFVGSSVALRGKTPACTGANCLAGRTSATIQAAVSNGFLTYFKNKLLVPAIGGPWIVSRLDDPNRIDYLKGLTDDQRHQKAGFLASFYLENLYITRLTLDAANSVIRFESAKKELRVDFKNIEITMQLNLQAKAFLSSTKERVVKVIVKKAEFGATFAIGMDPTGRPSVVSDATPIFVLPREGFDIEWLSDPKDKPSGFLNWIIDRFEGIITRIVASQVKKRFNEIVNPKLQGILASIPTRLQVDPPTVPQSVTVAMGLNQPPDVLDSGLDIMMQADPFLTSIGSCSKCPTPVIPRLVPDKYLSLSITDRIACCASNMALDMGLLKVEKSVPKPAFQPGPDPVQKAIGPILDAIFNVYEIKYKVNIPEAPQISFLDGSVRVLVKVDAEVHLAKAAHPNDLSDATRFAGASVSAEVGASLSVTDKAVLKYSLGKVKVNVDQLQIKGEKLSDSIRVPLTNFINFIVEHQVITKVNELTQAGFPIPSAHGLTLVSPSISLKPGFINIATNAEYEIPTDEILAMFTRRATTATQK